MRAVCWLWSVVLSKWNAASELRIAFWQKTNLSYCCAALQRVIIISQGIMKVWVTQTAVDRRKVLDRVSFGSLNFVLIPVLIINLCMVDIFFLQRDDTETSRILRVFLSPQ